MTEFLAELWHIILEASPYLLFGFLFAGLIKAFINESYIQKHLGSESTASVFKASLFGIPLPLCSCGVVPTAVSLRKEGASKGATTSFLVSTPESGVDSIAISYALLDPILTVVRPVAAFVTAFFAGLFESRMTLRNPEPQPVAEVKSCCSMHAHQATETEHKAPLGERMKDGIRYAFSDLSNDIALHLLIGLVMAAGISYMIPDSFFQTYLDDSIGSLLIMFIVGIPMYICATASTPIAAALILKGVSPGAALVFLMAGPATNLASIAVLQKSLGKKTILRLIASIAVFSLGFGYLTNLIYDWWAITPTVNMAHHGHSMLPMEFQIVCGILMSALILIGIWNENIRPRFLQAVPQSSA